MTERNWAGNHTFEATVIAHPATVEDLQELVIGANRIRALGSRHSFNSIADSSGTLLCLTGLNPTVQHAEFGTQYQPSAPGEDLSLDWCLGLADLAAAIREERPHRTGGEHAAHVVEVLEAIAQSGNTGLPVSVRSSFPSPLPAGPRAVDAQVSASNLATQ